MRKWIAGLLALTALSPIAAGAQETQDDAERAPASRGNVRVEARADDIDRPAPRARADGGERRRDDDGPRPDRGPRADGPRFERPVAQTSEAPPPDAAPDRGRGERPGPDRGDRAEAPGRMDRGFRGGDGDRAGWGRRADRPGSDAPRVDDARPRPGRDGGWQRPGVDRPARPRGDDWRRDRRTDRGDRQRAREDRRDRDWAGSRFDGRDDGWWGGSSFGDRDGRGGGGGWDRGWRSDRRYDWNRYRVANRDAFRLPRYYAPYGWSGGYRRFAVGAGLSASLWSQGYWIDDPYAYRLPEAWGPYRWVRYYDDALLVDIRTGVVVDAAYGIFW